MSVCVQNLFSDKLEEKLELVKGISLANKDQFQLTPLPQVTNSFTLHAISSSAQKTFFCSQSLFLAASSDDMGRG